MILELNEHTLKIDSTSVQHRKGFGSPPEAVMKSWHNYIGGPPVRPPLVTEKNGNLCD